MTVMRASLLAVTITTSILGLSGRALAQGAEPADAEEMRREIRSLKAQLAAMKAAMAEAAEFDRLRANALVRALGSPSGSSAAAETPSTKAPAVPEPAARRGAPARTPAPAASRRAQAPAPAAEPAAGGSVKGRVEVPRGEPVAYVYVENLRGASARGEKVKIEQQNKQFIPPWAVVQRGTTIEFPNLDNIYHNVFSLSSGNTFDLGLYNSSGEAKTHVFEEPGAVDIYCNIHPQMAASVLVVPNRYFAKVKGDGTFEITGVPSGKRKVVAWSPGSRLSAEWVEVQPGGGAEISFRLEPKAGGHKNKLGRPYGSYE
jgi:plastocyanin